MSLAAMTWAFAQQGLEPVEKLTLLALADYANDDGECFPGQTSIAAKVGVSGRTVIRVLQILEVKERLHRTRRADSGGHRKTDFYTLALGDNLTHRPEPTCQIVHAKVTTVSPTNNIRNEPSVEPPDAHAHAREEDPLGELVDEVWRVWPSSRRGTRKVVTRAVRTAVKAVGGLSHAETITGPLRQDTKTWAGWSAADQRFVPLLSTWLNQERWTGARAEPRDGGTVPDAPRRGWADLTVVERVVWAAERGVDADIMFDLCGAQGDLVASRIIDSLPWAVERHVSRDRWFELCDAHGVSWARAEVLAGRA